MNNKDIDQARKLSSAEMEGQKGGATFASLSKFIVKADVRRPVFGGFNPAADTVMCAGQTRSGDLTINQVNNIRQLPELSQLTTFR